MWLFIIWFSSQRRLNLGRDCHGKVKEIQIQYDSKTGENVLEIAIDFTLTLDNIEEGTKQNGKI